MASPTDAQKAHLRSLIRELLLSSECQKIDFDFAFSHGYGFNRHKVDGNGFAFVARCLATPLHSGRGISVGLNAERRRQANDVHRATYSYQRNHITVPSLAYGHKLQERCLLVHECTHALRDSLGVRSDLGRTRAVEEEAEAYIAGALYLIYETNASGWTPAPTQPTWVAALAVARKIADKPGALVDVGEHADLRKVILADPMYKDMRNNMDYYYTPAPDGLRA
jgi:hypothetical protein